jgi:glycosyltransferase involved in cell wall biosynthesis
MSVQQSGISTILPNYNHGQYVRRAIEAILQQDHPPVEIIVVDDGSTDGSLSIIDELASTSPLLRVFRNPTNEGVVSAQTRALAAARGAYVHFAAADDIVLPGFYALAIAMLEQHPHAGLFTGDSFLVDGTSGRLMGNRPIAIPTFKPGYLAPERVRKALAHADNWILTGASVIRASAVQACGGLDGDLGSFADGYLARKIALKNGYCYATTPVAIWTIFSDSFSNAAALNPDRALTLRKRARERLAGDPAFPPCYATRFVDRHRFATARVALQQKQIDISKVIELGALRRIDGLVIRFVLAISGSTVGRVVSIAWLHMRLRPFRLTHIAASAVYRKLLGRHHAGVQAALRLRQ